MLLTICITTDMAKWYLRAMQHWTTANEKISIRHIMFSNDTHENPLICNNENITDVVIIKAISFFFIINISTYNKIAHTNAIINPNST